MTNHNNKFCLVRQGFEVLFRKKVSICKSNSSINLIQEQIEGKAETRRSIQRSRFRFGGSNELRRPRRRVRGQAQVQTRGRQRNPLPRRKPRGRRLRFSRASKPICHLQVNA